MKLNPEYVKVASKMIDESPYLKLLGTTTELLDAGHYRCRMELDRKHTNMFGGINGGVNAGLLDSVTYWCLLCCMPEDVGYTTIDLTVNDMHSAKSGIIYAEGEVIKHGRTISLTEGRITDEKGTLIAYGTSKLFASPTIQPMSLAAEYLDVYKRQCIRRSFATARQVLSCGHLAGRALRSCRAIFLARFAHYA